MRSAIRSLTRSSRPKNQRPNHFIARHLTLWLVLLISGAVVLLSFIAGARAESRKSAARPGTMRMMKSVERQANSVDGASAQLKSTAILTLQNAPDIPQCHEILNQAILDLVNTASEDPAQTFENNRLAQPHSIMVPAPLNCASKLWMAVRRSSRPTEFGEFADSATNLESLALRQNPIETSFNPAALNASVATNTNPAGGVEEYQGTSSIAIDPNNPLHLIGSSNSFYRDPTSTCQSPTGGTANTYGTLALFGSIDGGATWTYNCAPWPATITGGVTGATFWFGSYPTLAWDNQGQAYASYLLISQSASAYGAAIVVARSSDNGASWQSLGTVVNGIASTTQGNDKEMMAIDNTSGQAFSRAGRIYVTWQAANAQKIAFSDNGTAWTTVNFPSNTGASGGNLVIGADGTVYVIWSRYNVETIVFSKSTDGGATWTAPQVIATLALQSYGTNNKPPAQDKRGVNGFGAIDVDRNPASAFFGNLYVAFSDFPTGTTTGADLDTYLIRSTNGGAAWSSRVKVNDDNFGATQMLPWLAVDQSDGTVNVSWYDTRLDPLNRKTQAVYARSTDGGVLFEPNVLVSDGGSAWRNNVNYSDENSADNTAYNSNQFGDYSGLAALNRQAHPIWTDSRMFFPVADTQSPSRKEDTATATITNCSAPSAIASPGVNPSTAPNVAISWSAPAGWGTNTANGTYSIFRDTSSVFPSGSPLASALTSTSYVDTTGNSGTTYYYFVRAKNNCPGTALTPMSTDSPASAAVVFGATGTPTGILQGTVTAGSSPLAGVIVTAGTFSATTNASGYYLLTAINASTYSVSASPAGYSPVSVNGVVVSGGGTTVQNLALSPISSGSSCFTDTTYFDLSTGGGSNLDISSAPGDVKLRNLGIEATDQVSAPAALSTTNNLSATTWTGQTYRAGVTGNLTKLTVGLGLASGTSGTITVEIRNLNGINPGTTVLATGTLGPVTNVGTAVLYTTTFASPAALVSGTSYSIVLRTSVGSTVFGVRGSTAGGSSLPNGQVFTTTNSGTTWTPVAADLWFTTYVTPPTTFVASGNLISAVKDANSVVGLVPRWLTLSWTMTNPANTTVQFQAAASNNVNGPFDFVGPDGTASTFFSTTGASLSQFNGFRYLKYKALLSTTDNIVTPALNDVTVCFNTDTPLIAAAAPLSRQQAAGAANAQIATVSDPGQAANTLTVSSTALTGTGVIINNIIIDSAGKVTADVAASCTATNSTFTLTVTNSGCTTATATFTVNVTAIDTPAITPGGPTTFCEGGSITLTSSSASGNQWYLDGNPIGGATNQAYVANASGSYTTTVTASGCPPEPSAATTVTVNSTPATPTITPDGPTTFCAGSSVTLTSSSASGNQWYMDGNPVGGAANQTYVATASGNYTNIVTANGCPSGPSSATSVTVNPTPATPTITPGGPTTFCETGSVALTSSSATGNQWYLDGNPIGGATNQAYSAIASGNYTNIVTASGCPSAPAAATTVTVTPTPPRPTVTPGGPTTFCESGSVTLASSSAGGNQWYLNGNPIGGATNQTYVASASGNYTNIVTANGCPSSPSTATTVAVNPTPATPTNTPGGPTTFSPGGSVTLTSSSATGNQWYLNGNPIGGATGQTYSASASGNYTQTVTASGCPSAPAAATTVTVNPTPGTPTVTPGGPTTFCAGGSVTLTSSNAPGNQWYLNGNPIGGATSQQYIATAAGDYTNTVTTNGSPSAPSTATSVTVNPIPATPTITPAGTTTLCANGIVSLTSSSTIGNQWYLNGNPIGGATAQQYNAAAAGDYSVTVTTLGCSSSPSAATTVTANSAPALSYQSTQPVVFGGTLNIAPTAASDDGSVTYQVLAGHGLATAPSVNGTGEISITNAQPAGAHSITVRATDNCGATTDVSFTLHVQSPGNVAGTNTMSGDFAPGSSITYTVTLSNSTTSPQSDNPGNEFTDVLPVELVLISASATSGTATANLGTNTVSWNGTLAGSGSVTITMTATLNNVADGIIVSNQGTINYDADGNGTNEASRLTDDPSVGGASDPTNFAVDSKADLTISKSHSGNFYPAQVGATYIITINNIGTGATDGTVTVTDTVPTGFTPTGPVGAVNGWTCTINGQTLTCTRSDTLAGGGASYPSIILTVNVANPAPLNVTNTATVSGGGEVNTSNNTTSDATAINCSPDFALNNGGPLVISRFRQNGPAGPQDEFVEIFNPGATAHTVASGTCKGGGYGVYASAGNGTTSNTASLVCNIPNGTVIPAGGYYLCTGVTYSLNNLGRNGGPEGATSVGDALIGCNGQCTNNIPNDAGLALINESEPTVNFPGGFGLVEFGQVFYDKVGFGPYGLSAPAPAGYPSLASTYCEGGISGCLKPVGDASTGAA